MTTDSPSPLLSCVPPLPHTHTQSPLPSSHTHTHTHTHTHNLLTKNGGGGMLLRFHYFCQTFLIPSLPPSLCFSAKSDRQRGGKGLTENTAVIQRLGTSIHHLFLFILLLFLPDNKKKHPHDVCEGGWRHFSLSTVASRTVALPCLAMATSTRKLLSHSPTAVKILRSWVLPSYHTIKPF